MDQRTAFMLIVATSVLVACAEEVSPAEQARIDAEKIAAVERASIVPPDPISPQRIDFRDYEESNLYGSGCAFIPEGGALDPIALTQAERAYMKVDDTIVRYASDKGGKQGPMGTWQKYDGKVHSIRLLFAPGEGKASGSETVTYPATLSVFNGRDQIVYRASGSANCGF
ncbi:hypothetical protein [Allopontixanthobacter sp.]|uniref:hypothetical protein n=1 Tax=Allopontixanthobacter sp. TaxID=2906452 RepID=UPI002ABA6EEC|nr:hypothetical protein [Allopontixanthobacter sp.]MDZ4307331.1 hypothetical protein [Allopontixanthobacter sp.]